MHVHEMHFLRVFTCADPLASSDASKETGVLVLVAPLVISTKAYVPLLQAVQVRILLCHASKSGV